jgi:hypothetical protein
MSHLSLRTAALPCLPLDIKDSLKEDARLILAFGFLEGRIAGERLLNRDSEWLKGNC